MSYNATAIENTIFDAVTLLLPGVIIIPADQDIARPTSDTYVTLKCTSDTGQGLREYNLTDTAGASAGEYVMEVQRFREIVLSVQAFGPDAYGTLRDMEARLDEPELNASIDALGVVLADSSGVSRLPAYLNTETEDRAVVTYNVRYVRTTTPEVKALDKIVATPVIDDVPQPPITIDGLDA